MKTEWHYELMDDSGSNSLELPIKLPKGTIFEHEYGKFEVTEIYEQAILCDKRYER